MGREDKPVALIPGKPISLTGPDFARRKYEWYRLLQDEAPVCPAKISFMRVFVLSRYEDCRALLVDDRFFRNRGRALGRRDSGPLPFPLPGAVAALANSMIIRDDPEHQRLRRLVNKAFAPHAVEALAERVESLTAELLDDLEHTFSMGPVDLLEAYARPIPTRVIGEMLGVSPEEMLVFQAKVRVLTEGFSGLRILRTLLWDLRGAANFVRGLIERKRAKPAADLLSRLIEAEDEGERLSEDELVAMVFLLIVAGFETTLHLIVNGARVLLESPDSRARLTADSSLWPSAVEEIVRYRGPVHGTKLHYASETLQLQGVTIKRGQAVMPLIGAANMDPRAFDSPERFEIERSPNHHLGFGFGRHFCLGRSLALMETQIGLRGLFDRFPSIRLAVPPDQLQIVSLPGWHRHQSLPVTVEGA